MADPEAAGDKNKLAEEKHGEHKKRAEPTDHPTVRAVSAITHAEPTGAVESTVFYLLL